MNTLKNINIINKSSNPLPKYETELSSGMDIRANLEEDIEILPSQTKIIPTGIYVDIPKGYEIQIRSRSGLAAKNSIFVLNSPGTIDADYRGEIKVILHNLSTDTFTVKNNDRIAQMVLAPVVQAILTEVKTLNETNRGDGGFGSTGV